MSIRITEAINHAEDHLHAAEHSNRAGMVNEMEGHLELANGWIMLADVIHNTTTDDEDDLSFEELMTTTNDGTPE